MDNYHGFVVGQKIKILLTSYSDSWGSDIVDGIRENPIRTINQIREDGVTVTPYLFGVYSLPPDSDEPEFCAVNKPIVVMRKNGKANRK